jgi:hypothetical protein
MRKLILHANVSLDRFIAGSENDLGSMVDDEEPPALPIRAGCDGLGMGRDRRLADQPLDSGDHRRNDDMVAPGISVEVPDVDPVHVKALEQGLEIAYPLRDEEWGVRRFMLRQPGGTIVNVLSHHTG